MRALAVLVLLSGGCLDPDSLGHLHDLSTDPGGDDLAMPPPSGHTLSWTRTSAGLGPGPFSTVAIDPVTPNTIYAGAVSNGVYKSLDGGATWKASSTGLGTLSLLSLAVDPVTPANVFAGTTAGGVFKSTDGGATWKAPTGTFSSATVNSVALDSAAPLVLYAASTAGLYKSTDGAATWTKLPPLGQSRAIAIDHGAPNNVYAGAVISGVSHSSDGGATWTPINTGLTDLHINALAVHPNYLFVATPTSLFRSVDHLTWQPVGPVLSASTPFTSVIVDPATPLNVYAAASNGSVYRSIDGGVSWASVLVAVSSGIASLAVQGANVYAASAGVFKSTNSAKTWAGSSTGLDNSVVQALAVDATNRLTVFVGTSFRDGPTRSTDGAVSWQSVGGLPSGNSVAAVAVDPSTSTNMYIATAKGVYKSTNRGGNFALLGNGLPATAFQAIAVDPATPANVYAGTASQGVFHSSDGGSTWSLGDAGIASVRAIAVDHANGDVFVSGDGSTADGGVGAGVFYSNDHGVSWQTVNDGFTTLLVEALAADPVTSGVVYAGTSGGGVFRTANSGTSWTPVNLGLGNTDVSSVAVDPIAPAVIYAGTHGTGVYQSVDSGAHWLKANDGLSVLDVRVLAISITGVVFAGTNGGGVFSGQ